MAPRVPTLGLHSGLLIAVTDCVARRACPEDCVPTCCLHGEKRKGLHMPRLTKQLVDETPFPSAGQVFARDTALSGFALRVTQ